MAIGYESRFIGLCVLYPAYSRNAHTEVDTCSTQGIDNHRNLMVMTIVLMLYWQTHVIAVVLMRTMPISMMTAAMVMLVVHKIVILFAVLMMIKDQCIEVGKPD